MCSSVKAIPVADSTLADELKNQRIVGGWGGILDLLEEPESPQTSKRNRCTFYPDYVPVAAGQQPNPAKLALWTADHCLDFTRAKGAELYIYDVEKKDYVNVRVEIPALNKYREGLRLFQERAQSAAVGDDAAESDLQSFIAAGSRPSVDYAGAPLIERGIPACLSDTQIYKSANSGRSVICSSVLDMARIDAFVPDDLFAVPEIKNMLERMSQQLKAIEDKKYADADLLVPEIVEANGKTMRANFKWYLENWRVRVDYMTRRRGFESQSALIEKVRTCATNDAAGICAPQFRSFFSGALGEYNAWTSADPVNAKRTFPTALHDEFYAEMSTGKMNLKWLLSTQANVTKALYLGDQAVFSVNMSREPLVWSTNEVTKTLGDVRPELFGLLKLSQIIGGTGRSLSDAILSREKTLMISYSTDNSSARNMFLQPGDSGSVLVIGNVPIGVVATVDGKATSGGASVLPLPEFTEEQNANQASAQKSNTQSVSCR